MNPKRIIDLIEMAKANVASDPELVRQDSQITLASIPMMDLMAAAWTVEWDRRKLERDRISLATRCLPPEEDDFRQVFFSAAHAVFDVQLERKGKELAEKVVGLGEKIATLGEDIKDRKDGN